MTIQGLFDILLPGMTEPARCGILEAVREVQGIIAGRLLLKRSELLLKDPDGTIDYAVDAQSGSLPADFWGLAQRPYVAGETPLGSLNNQDTAGLQDSATPKYYKLIGKTTLKVYPPTDTEITLQVPYFFKPPVLTDLANDLPFEAEFDSVFIEGCKGVLTRGLAVVADSGFVSVIQSQVDGVLMAKQQVDEQLLADDINGF